mgnify:CR=1 FL=1
MSNDMKLIMENWRGYKNNIETSEQLFEEVLLEEGISDTIGRGLAWIANKLTPQQFKEKTTTINNQFEAGFKEGLAKLAKDPEVVKAIKELAHEINTNKDKILKQAIQEEVEYDDEELLGVDPEGLKDKQIEWMLKLGVITQQQVMKTREALMKGQSEHVADLVKMLTGKEPPGFFQFLLLMFKGGTGQFIFGFIDNYIMVLVGEYIDSEIAAALQITTMGAAAIGNAWSDFLAELGKTPLDRLADKLGVDPKKINMTKAQKAILFLNGPMWIFIGAIVGWGAANATKWAGRKMGMLEIKDK